MEKSKKANECRNILNVGKKAAKLPRREIVEDPLCDLIKQKKFQKAVLSPENYAFEKLKNQQILLVGQVFELNIEI